jgi:uncharacterized membrane protein
VAAKAALQTAGDCPSPRRAIAVVICSCLLQTLFLSSLLSEPAYCPFLSTSFWTWQVEMLGGEVQLDQQTGQAYATMPLGMLFATILLKSLVMLIVVGTAAAKLARRPVKEVILRWAWLGWLWLCVFGGYELLRLGLQMAGFFDAADVLGVFAYYFSAIGVAGCLAMIVPAVRAASESSADSRPVDLAPADADLWSISRATLAAVAIFSVVFTAMNWQIFNGLLLPHGDSAMYGEHLWNITHGKGFRSYLDQGLFLGEHVQVVHLLLLPLYVVWPSQLLLELCETLTLAAGALPVFWMARRHSGSTVCGSLLAIAWLLYTPLQYLDIEIDLKTFRPMSFGVTAMLFGIDFFERGRFKSTAACFLLALAAKEDFALILIPLGVWLAGHAWWQRKTGSANLRVGPVAPKRGLVIGAGLTAFSLAYLLLVTRIVIPWFRNWEEVHYARYFAKFGDSLGEIIVSMLTDPALVFDEFVTLTSANYLLALFVPLAFLPFLSPGRLLVAAPILGLLCLNEIVKSDPFPRHHFQGPVLPILFWAAAAGLGVVKQLPEGRRRAILNRVLPGGAVTVATFGCLAAMQSGAMLGMSPASLSFWDSGSPNHFSRYVPGERAEMIELVLAEIPENSRVASTDYVHTRLIHYERSYDYSGYRRKVAGDKEGVPDDTDFIVLDTKHRYSNVHSPADVRELQTEPEQWEFLDELYKKANGCFIVLKRRE